MSSHFPGRGLKKPMNVIDAPIYPDIRKAPPRFVWSKKHWTVDTGKTMAEVEHIPQLQEAAVLYQSYDYGSQHSYGKRPTYTAFVNKEFRPPLIERDDIMPLSRLPRPVAVPRINPSGNTSFAEQNLNLPGIEKYLTNRVKEGQIEPTFFCPIDKPEDNSVLPDLDEKMPSYSAGAGFNFPTAADTTLIPNRESMKPSRNHNQIHPAQFSGITTINVDAPNASGKENFTLDYVNPQISASSGSNHITTSLMEQTPLDLDLFYTNPQISATAGSNHINTSLLEQTPLMLDRDYTNPQISSWAGINRQSSFSDFTNDKYSPEMQLEYNRPNYSVGAGVNTKHIDNINPIEYELKSKLEGSVPSDAGINMSHINMWSSDASRASVDESKVYNIRPDISYVIPSNVRYKDENDPGTIKINFRRKVSALGNYQPQPHQSVIQRSGVTIPQISLKNRKDA